MPLKKNDLGIGKLREDLAKARETEITIGWQGPSGAAEHPNADATVAQVGAWQEYGTPTAPARPALQTAFDEHGDDFRDASRKALSDLVDGRADFDELAPRLGDAATEAVRKTIDRAAEWADPLSERTIAKKGHAQPLLDTGTLRDSVSWAERWGSRSVRQGGEAS